MNLKDFFLLLAENSQNVEIYYRIGYDVPTIGFKINEIDSNEIEINNKTIDSINNEIIKYIDKSGLISLGEGNTSYFLQPNNKCKKNADYFDLIFETHHYWINQNNTVFDFGKTEIPLQSILITKNLNEFIIHDVEELNKFISHNRIENFTTFYKNLLFPFQVLEIELQFDVDNQSNTFCYIHHMDGSYMEELPFTLLDESNEDFSIEDLTLLLRECFNINPSFLIE